MSTMAEAEVAILLSERLKSSAYKHVESMSLAI